MGSRIVSEEIQYKTAEGNCKTKSVHYYYMRKYEIVELREHEITWWFFRGDVSSESVSVVLLGIDISIRISWKTINNLDIFEFLISDIVTKVSQQD